MNKVEKFVEKFAESLTDQPLSVDRLVTESSHLTPEEMMSALSHPAVGRAGIDLMADFMHPTDSRYFDAIYGSYYGQKNIRAWLVPMMSEISFIEFVPTSEPEFFDDGEGVTTLDEWQMVADMQAMGMGEGKMPMSRGVSVRRYRDSWMTWACDVYDTGSFRVPPPPGVEAAPLPDAPSPKEWQRHLATPVTVCSEVDFDADCDQFHPTDSVYHDPIFGVFHGRDEIKSWIMDIMPRVGNIEFMPVGPELNNGKSYLQEWVQVAVTSDGERVPMFRGTSVRRYRDGFTIYAADYFDTASLTDPEVMAASAKCGSSLTAADIMKYKMRGV